jgi:hypothetical protein
MTKRALSAERLRELVKYDPETGIFTRRIATSNRIKVGDLVGSPMAIGYFEASIGGRRDTLHRFAWLYMTGEWPDGDIDHRDLDESNTRWGNLRCGSHAQNIANQKTRIDTVTGVKGVCLDRRTGRFAAYVTINQRKIHLGMFESKEDAGNAYREAATRHFGEFARCD